MANEWMAHERMTNEQMAHERMQQYVHNVPMSQFLQIIKCMETIQWHMKIISRL